MAEHHRHRSSWFPGSGSARGRGTRSPTRCAPTATTSPPSPCPAWSPRTPTARRSRSSDHVDAIVEAVEAADGPVVLAVHSATGFSGYAASDRVPGADRGDGLRRHRAREAARSTRTSTGDEKPMVWEEIEEEENLDGLSEEQKETFRERAVPVPGGVLRESRRAHERRAARHPEHAHLHRRSRPSSTRPTPGSTPSGRSWPASRSCATPPGSTCRRATGRCGRGRRSSREIIGDVARASGRDR